MFSCINEKIIGSKTEMYIMFTSHVDLIIEKLLFTKC